MSARVAVIIVILVAAATLYTANLNTAPIYLSNDETEFAIQSQSIATTARDIDGRFLPLYFHVVDNSWFHPGLFYLMAPVMAVTRPMPWAVRLPIALVAVFNVLAVFLIARRLGLSELASISASVFLALTPAHVLLGRVGVDYLLPVPCVLLWLLLLLDYRTSNASWRLLAAGAVLGLGLYIYIASLVMMPLYLLMTIVVLAVTGTRDWRAYSVLIGGFLVLMLPLAAWHVARPEIYRGFVQRYGGAGLDVVHQPPAFFEGVFLRQRWSVFRSFFSWSFLFALAETNVQRSTYLSGIFLKPMEVFLPLGIYHMLRNCRSVLTVLILAAFVSAPLAASLIPERYTIERAASLLALGALIGAFGVDWLLVRRSTWLTWAGRAVCACLCVWMVYQFEGFYRDYQTHYRVRSAFWFNGNHPGAFEPIVRDYRREDPRTVYIFDGLPWIREHWRLYLLQHNRTDLLARTVYFRPESLDVARIPSGSVLLAGWDDPASRTLKETSGLSLVGQTLEPDGTISFLRFQRDQD
jgi:4-amino-4-deoxy-L-arabinose transferase-like glycosyltransferase